MNFRTQLPATKESNSKPASTTVAMFEQLETRQHMSASPFQGSFGGLQLTGQNSIATYIYVNADKW